MCRSGACLKKVYLLGEYMTDGSGGRGKFLLSWLFLSTNWQPTTVFCGCLGTDWWSTHTRGREGRKGR